MLVPKIKICQTSNCSHINIFEQTNPENPNNLTGWGNTNIDTNVISTATIVITDYTDNTILETFILKDNAIDLYTPVAGSPTPSSFLALSEQDFTHGDGVYNVAYTIIDNQTNEYTSEPQRVLFICNILSCLGNLKKNTILNCDSKELKKIKHSIDQLELIIYGIKYAFSCDDIETVNKLITEASIFCDNLCDCGCGDC